MKRLEILDGRLRTTDTKPQGSDYRRRHEERATVYAEFEKLTNELKVDPKYHNYFSIIDRHSLSVLEVQRLLHPGETVVNYLVTQARIYLWVVQPNRISMHHSSIARPTLRKMVKGLRRMVSMEDGGRLKDVPRFDVETAHELYKLLFAPTERLLGADSHVFLVPDAVLQSFPFSLLVTEAPKKAITNIEGYKAVPWLAKKRYALTVLPSMASLQDLRGNVESSQASKSFIGFGDPQLRDNDKGEKASFFSRIFSFKRIGANVDELSSMPELPETADELRRISEAVGGREEDIYLQEAATETLVKSTNLMAYQNVAFATHGLLAQELENLTEPALVLTSPSQKTDEDDGLLSASEIAQLKLNADMIILSACNTAADGEANAAGLSGLAEAFFYAGSRTVLVSHWKINSEATVALITGMFEELANNPDVPRAEALRRSMLALMNDEKRQWWKPRRYWYAHPMFWAPFVVMGEGAVDSRGRLRQHLETK